MGLWRKRKSAPRRAADKVTDTIAGAPRAVALAGIAAAGAVGAAAWLSTRRNGHGIALHVETDGNGGWQLRVEGQDDPVARYENKKDAVASAREYAREHGPSMLTIHKESGAVSRRHVYAEA